MSRHFVHPLSILLCALICGAGAACDQPGPSKNGAVLRAQTVARDSAGPRVDTPTTSVPILASPRRVEGIAGPRETLAAYLAASVFRTPVILSVSLTGCGDPVTVGEGESDEGFEPDGYIAIARPRVLGIRGGRAEPSEDSYAVEAEVIVLAKVTRDASGWVARISASTDTLVWTVVRRTAGGWSVCGPAQSASENRGGLPLFLVTEQFARRGEISSARWPSPGTTWDAVARLADSLRAAP